MSATLSFTTPYPPHSQDTPSNTPFGSVQTADPLCSISNQAFSLSEEISPVCELAEDQLLNDLSLHSSIPTYLRKIRKILGRNSNLFPTLHPLSLNTPSLNEEQAAKIIDVLFKKMSFSLQHTNYIVEFSLIELFAHLLKKTSERNGTLPEILDIERIDSNAPSLLPGVANQLLEDSLHHSLDSTLIHNLEGVDENLRTVYRFNTPPSTVDSFQEYEEILIDFFATHAKERDGKKPLHHNNKSLTPLKKQIREQCPFKTPEMFYYDCQASFSILDDATQKPCSFAISQHTGESNFFKTNLHVSLKPIVEKYIDFSRGGEKTSLESFKKSIQASIKEKEFQPVLLKNDAKLFWEINIKRQFPSQKNFFELHKNSLAQAELWQTCMDRLTHCVHINEPIYPSNRYGGWLLMILETLKGNRPTCQKTEKTLIAESFDVLQETLHPEEIQQKLDENLSSKKWETISAYLLSGLAKDDFEFSIALLTQASITLHRTGYADHIDPLWSAMHRHLQKINPKKASDNLWTSIYEAVVTHRIPFRDIIHTLTTKAFLISCSKYKPENPTITTSLCLFEGAPTLRLKDEKYCLHLPIDQPIFSWKGSQEPLTTLAFNKDLENISSFLGPHSFSPLKPEQHVHFNYKLFLRWLKNIVSDDHLSFPWKHWAVKTLLSQFKNDSWPTFKELLPKMIEAADKDLKQHDLVASLLQDITNKTEGCDRETPIPLLYALALVCNTNPEKCEQDIHQAFELWMSYNKIKPRKSSKTELELLLKIAAYRPDLAINIFQSLLNQKLLNLSTDKIEIKNFIISTKKILNNGSKQNKDKLFHIFQQIISRFKDPEITETILKSLFENINAETNSLSGSQPIEPSKTKQILLEIISNLSSHKFFEDSSLILSTLEQAIQSEKLEITAPAVMEIISNFPKKCIYPQKLLQDVLKKYVIQDRNGFYKILSQFLHLQKTSESFKSKAQEALADFSLLFPQMSTTDQEQQKVASDLFQFLIPLCASFGEDPTKNYETILPLAHLCLLKTPSQKSAFFQCLIKFKDNLKKAAENSPKQNDRLLHFLQSESVQSVCLPRETRSEKRLKLRQEQIEIVKKEFNKDEPNFETIRKDFPKSHTELEFILKEACKDVKVEKLVKMLLSFSDSICKLIENHQPEKTIETAIDIWNAIETAYADNIQRSNSKTAEILSIKAKMIANYKLLLNGLTQKNNAFKQSLAAIENIFTDCYQFKNIFSKTALQYLTLLPEDSRLQYTKTILQKYLWILNQASTNKITPAKILICEELFVTIGKTIPRPTCIQYMKQLEKTKKIVGINSALCLLKGSLISEPKAPLAPWIVNLLEEAKWQSAPLIFECLTLGKEALFLKTQENIRKKSISKIENGFQKVEPWKSAYSYLCNVYLDLLMHPNNYPIDSEETHKILCTLVYLHIADNKWPLEKIRETLNSLAEKLTTKENSEASILQNLYFNFFKNLLIQPVHYPEHFDKLLKSICKFFNEVLKTSPTSENESTKIFPIDRKDFFTALYSLCIRDLADLSFKLEMYPSYQNTIIQLIDAYTEKEHDFNVELIFFPLVEKACLTQETTAENMTQAAQEYFKVIKVAYENSKSQGIKTGLLHCKRLKSVAENTRFLFKDKENPLIFTFADFMMQVAFDYAENNDPLFQQISDMAAELIKDRSQFVKKDRMKRSQMFGKWGPDLATSLHAAGPKLATDLLCLTLSEFLEFDYKINIDEPKQFLWFLQNFEQRFPLPITQEHRQTIYPSLMTFLAFSFEDSCFKFGSNQTVDNTPLEDPNRPLDSYIEKLVSNLYQNETFYPPLLALMFRSFLKNFNNNDKAIAFNHIQEYFQKVENKYSISKNGYSLFKRLSSLLINSHVKDVFDDHYDDYLKIVQFLIKMRSDYIENPSICKEMTDTLNVLVKFKPKTLPKEQHEKHLKFVTAWRETEL